MIESLHQNFCKYVLRVQPSTPNFYGTCIVSLGEYPIKIDIKCRMINYWLKLVNEKESKYSTIMYHTLLSMYHFVMLITILLTNFFLKVCVCFILDMLLALHISLSNHFSC